MVQTWSNTPLLGLLSRRLSSSIAMTHCAHSAFSLDSVPKESVEMLRILYNQLELDLTLTSLISQQSLIAS